MSKNMDQLLKEIAHERIESIVPSPKEDVWEQIKIELRRKRKKESFKRLKPKLVACIILVVLTVGLVNFYTPVKAFTAKMIKSIGEITGDTFTIRKLVNLQLEDEEPVDMDSKYIDPRINDAQREVSFDIPIPGYIPEGYELYAVDVFNKDKGREKVNLLYINTNEEDKKGSFEIEVQSFPIGSESEMKYVLDDDTKVEDVDINGIEYSLLSHDKSYNILFWDSGNMSYKIDGNLSKKDIFKIADSME